MSSTSHWSLFSKASFNPYKRVAWLFYHFKALNINGIISETILALIDHYLASADEIGNYDVL